MRNRSLLFGMLALVMAPLAPALAAPIAVDGGSIEGITLTSGIRAWLGVPFAAPPVRELRWKPPQPVTPWRGLRHAERAAPMCLQALRSRTMNHYFGDEATSEDCLYLNIWAPASGERLPVIVWIYGGGFNVGSASMANYSGEGLAREGVVRVNLAYRVGPLGFLAHPELTRESGQGGSGNYGLMDQIAALRWVQRNIQRFGGDPGNVTIAGQSAGSTSVALLQASPAAAGLFHRVVGMSGSPFGPPMQAVPLTQGEAEGLELQRALGAHSIEQMRDIAGDRILAANAPRSAIVTDGAILPAAPDELFAAHRQNDVPVMMGFTRDESFLPLGAVSSPAEYEKAIRRVFPATAERVLAAYPAQDSATARRAAADVSRDASVGLAMWQWATAQQSDGRQPAWVYYFTRRQPYATGVRFSDHDPATAGAYHSGEIPYFLRTRESLNLFRHTRDWGAVDEEIERTMSRLLLEFARTGVPRVPLAGAWPRFEPGNPKVLQLGEKPAVIDWPNHRALPLLRGAVFQQAAPAAPGRVRD